MHRSLCLTAVVLCLLATPLVAQPSEITPQQACCGVKPVYNDPAYASFTGQVAVVTYEQVPPTTDVMRIIDLSGITTTTPPPNTNYIPPVYKNPGWSAARLGTIFGTTLDNAGNIYVAATTIYSTKAVGAGGTFGTVYKIANGTGSVTNLATLPSSATLTMNPAGLGNIAFDCGTHTLFVTDFDNGLIYQLDPTTGVIKSTFDHGIHLTTPIPDDLTKTYTPLGRRVWAVRPSGGRLYYSVWSKDQSNTGGTQMNEIWSVGLNSTFGFVVGSQHIELSMPAFQPTWSNPVAGISFGPGGKTLLAERSMYTNGGVIETAAHNSRLLEYAAGWTPGNTFLVGAIPNSSAGSAVYDYTPGAAKAVWPMGDAVQFGPAYIYGLQGMPSTGGTVANSVLIDVSGTTTQANKYTLGSVAVPCPTCLAAEVAIKGPETACQSPGVYCANGPLGASYSWSVTGGTFIVQSPTCIKVSWNLTGPYVIAVTATQPNGCQTTVKRSIAPCAPVCCDVPIKADLKSITLLGNGNYNITAALTAPMGNIKRIKATIVSTYEQLAPASCGPSGSVWSYINAAPPQNGFWSSVPQYWREVTWIHPTGVPVSNMNFTFELAVPPLPNGDCADQIRFCVVWEFTSVDCHTCQVTTCWKIARGNLVANPITPIPDSD
jgi:hypothetical protein